MARRLGLITFAVLLAHGAAWAQEPEPAAAPRSCFDKLANGQRLTSPPATPVKVQVGIDIVAFRQIESASETFDADFYLVLRWKDPRLVSARYPDLECTLERDEVWAPPAKLWGPRPEFINLRSQNGDGKPQVTISGDGSVNYWSRLSGTFDAWFSLAAFPFDSQTLSIELESSFDRGQVIFEPIEALSGETEAGKRWSKKMPQWVLDNLRTTEAPKYWVADDEEFSRFTLQVRAQRRYGFYVWKVFAPLLLIVMLSWSVFWMSSDHFDGQMAVSITCLLALVAFNFVISDELPKISYLTALDRAILIAYIFVFFAAVENVLIHGLERRERTEAALRVERVSRWLFPGAYIAANAAFVFAAL